jgi:copper chaperone CopZ
MSAHTLQITGMTCDHCVRTVENSLNALPGVKARVSYVQGQARFKDAHTLEVVAKDGSVRILRPDRMLIATGAILAIPPIPGLAETPYWTSMEALVAKDIPKHLIILGGSAVGLEIGQAFLRPGAQITMIELYSLLPKEDPETRSRARKRTLTGIAGAGRRGRGDHPNRRARPAQAHDHSRSRQSAVPVSHHGRGIETLCPDLH